MGVAAGYQETRGVEYVADPTCTASPFCAESDCGDGVDNDGDGDTDCCDSDCATDLSCAQETACFDGVDNDCDGDPDCTL